MNDGAIPREGGRPAGSRPGASRGSFQHEPARNCAGPDTVGAFYLRDEEGPSLTAACTLAVPCAPRRLAAGVEARSPGRRAPKPREKSRWELPRFRGPLTLWGGVSTLPKSKPPPRFHGGRLRRPSGARGSNWLAPTEERAFPSPSRPSFPPAPNVQRRRAGRDRPMIVRIDRRRRWQPWEDHAVREAVRASRAHGLTRLDSPESVNRLDDVARRIGRTPDAVRKRAHRRVTS